MVMLRKHTITIAGIAFTDKFTSFMEGSFEVRVIEPSFKDVVLDLTTQAVVPSLSWAGQTFYDPNHIYETVVNKTLARARTDGVTLPWHRAQTAEDVILTFSRIPIHSECNLLAYHHYNSDPYIFNYIGTSHLSCFACHAYVHAYNAITQDDPSGPTPFAIKGYIGDIHFPWAAPILDQSGSDSSIDAIIGKRLIDGALQPMFWAYCAELDGWRMVKLALEGMKRLSSGNKI